MVIKNHISYRFLTDSNLWMEMLESQYPDIYAEFEKGKKLSEGATGLYHCLSNDNNKPYLVTNSVIENLEMLKIKKEGDHFNWKVFNKLPDQKVTFIFNEGACLRMLVTEKTVWFCHLVFKYNKESKNTGEMYWVMFYFDRETGELCDHFAHPDVKNLEEFIYKFLCFFYLTENTEQIIPAGKVHGTRKTGKISNDFKFPLTVVTSKWNITSIRTEEFGVRGHFRVQPCGQNRSNYEIIFIEPFVKSGYKRTSAKLLTT